jgi:hypothetical protein
MVDTSAMSAADAETALAAVADGTRLLVLSSMDVYRAYGAVLAAPRPTPCPWTRPRRSGPSATPLREGAAPSG